MKRINPAERKRIATDVINTLMRSWTCSYGEWNRDKLMDSVEQKLRQIRRERKPS